GRPGSLGRPAPSGPARGGRVDGGEQRPERRQRPDRAPVPDGPDGAERVERVERVERQRRPRQTDPVALERELMVRRAATAGLAVVAVGATVFAAVQLAGGGGKANGSRNETTTTRGSQATTTTVAPTTTTTPSILKPVSLGASVSYHAPAADYSITFDATGPCWLGIQHVLGSSSWSWMDTLSTGQTTKYSATGYTVVRIGAPANVQITVDGLPVQLPSRSTPPYDEPYDITFG
ncbi:MAG TPA: RodZ domain-containing protein, partial [Acidimicrobiales bacterium]|nr:RodZ domain-containing protein [Acidimicrobiales bacterium]